VQVFENRINKADRTGFVKPADFIDFRKRARNIEGFATYDSGPVTWSGQGEAERLSEGMVSPNFFRILRADPVLGRSFDDSEEQPGKHRVVLLSYGFWKNRLGGDAAVVGGAITLDGNNFTVIGVLPEPFRYADVGSPDVWVPFVLPPGITQDRYGSWMQVIARLRSSTSMAQAQGEMEQIAAQLRKEYPTTNQDVGVHIAPLQKDT
jgi:putative ABC transport system permease protein